MFNESELLERFKVEVLPIDMVQFIRHAKDRATANAAAYADEVKRLRAEMDFVNLDDITIARILAVRDQMLAAVADNGLDGLGVILREKPDIVITDIRMPGLDGLTMIERASEQHPVCAYIVISGYREYEYARRALALNVLDYVEKPILLNSIVSALTRAGKHLEGLRHLKILEAVGQEKETARVESRNRAMNSVLDYIHENFSRDIGLTDLSEATGLVPAYLCNLFKECVGVSYIKYLTSVRLDHAKRLLQSGEKAMKVAEKVGYSDYHYFCRVFKKYTGVTPGEYREHSLR
jgi:two-component system response regulator YesN